MKKSPLDWTSEESDVIHALEVVYAGRSEYFYEYVDDCYETVKRFIMETIDAKEE